MKLFLENIPNFKNDFVEDCAQYYNDKYNDRIIVARGSAERVCDQIKGIIDEGKICITVDHQTFKHSTPIIIKGDDLFVLRDERYNLNFINECAKKLGLTVRRLNIINPDKSMQHKSSSECHMMALGILKDTNFKDITLSDGFVNPSPKLLKYAQSLSYVRENFPELLYKEVKEGVTLEQYILKYEKKRSDEKRQKMSERLKNA